MEKLNRCVNFIFSNFKNSNFNDVFNSGNNQKTETKTNVEDVEEV